MFSDRSYTDRNKSALCLGSTPLGSSRMLHCYGFWAASVVIVDHGSSHVCSVFVSCTNPIRCTCYPFCRGFTFSLLVLSQKPFKSINTSGTYFHHVALLRPGKPASTQHYATAARLFYTRNTTPSCEITSYGTRNIFEHFFKSLILEHLPTTRCALI